MFTRCLAWQLWRAYYTLVLFILEVKGLNRLWRWQSGSATIGSGSHPLVSGANKIVVGLVWCSDESWNFAWAVIVIPVRHRFFLKWALEATNNCWSATYRRSPKFWEFAWKETRSGLCTFGGPCCWTSGNMQVRVAASVVVVYFARCSF